MTVTRRQAGTNSASGGTAIAVTLPSAPVAGNLLVIHHYIGGQDTSAMAGPAGFTTAIQTSGVSSAGAAIYWKISDGTEGTTYTCSKGVSTAFSALEIMEWDAGTPWVATGIVDATGMATGGSGDLTLRVTASAPTTQANVLAVASVGTTQSGSYGGWTDGWVDDGLAAVGGRQTSGQKQPTAVETLTTSNTWTSGGFARMVLAAFKVPSSGATPGKGSGTAAWSVTASGTGTTKRTGAGTASWSVTASGSGSTIRSGSGTAAWSVTASGSGGEPIPAGAGVAPWSAAATGIGVRQPVGSSVASWSATASGDGVGPAPSPIIHDYGTATLASDGVSTAVLASDGTSTAALAVQALATLTLHTND